MADSFEKRQRERKKQQKKREKAQRKRDRAAGKLDGDSPEANTADGEADLDGGDRPAGDSSDDAEGQVSAPSATTDTAARGSDSPDRADPPGRP